MGSRVMHYCISALLADRLEIDNRNEFMLGGIAADIHGFMGVDKGVTHFKDTYANGESRINYVRFYNAYQDRIHEPFYLGYLCHLISDVAYLDTYFKIVQFTSTEQWKEKLLASYRDFERLNGRIISQYSLTLNEHTVPCVEIDGYNSDFHPTLLQHLRRDFIPDEALMNEPLELFKNDNSEITTYIRQSVNDSLEFLATHR
jgi:hypothetical protein